MAYSLRGTHRGMSMKFLTLGVAAAALLASVEGWCSDSPSLQGEVLFLPRVDTPDQVGLYQNGTLRRNADGTWSLLSVQAPGVRGTFVLPRANAFEEDCPPGQNCSHP